MEPLKPVDAPKGVRKPFYEDIADASEHVERMRTMLAKCYNATDSGPNNEYYLKDPTEQEIENSWYHLKKTVGKDKDTNFLIIWIIRGRGLVKKGWATGFAR